jgi:predicted aspartyl protease
MQLPGGIVRPMIAVAIEGPNGRRLLDGLLDTGSDRTIFPTREARAIGIPLPSLPDGSIRTAGGVAIAFRIAEVVLELRGAGSLVRWKTPVAFAGDPLSLIHLGTRGFLEYFHCTFLGPERKILLDPRPSLPLGGP